MGWYDGNPVHLAELTPSDYAQKLVEYFGDTDAVLEKAKEDFAKGEYQWVAQITNTLVFADPENMDARYLCADALEQLGYQAESGPWRSAYLCAAFFVVSINTGAYMAETVRGGILSVDEGQTEAAKAIGMTHVQTMMNVILPQALRNIMPQIGNNLISNIKDTCVLSIIGIVELFYTTKGVAGAYYTYFESFTIAMVMYFILTFVCSRLLRLLEHKMEGPQNYDLATTDTLAHTSGLYSYPKKKEEK